MQQNETLKLRVPEAQEAVRTPGKVQSPEAEAWIDRIKKDLETVKEKEKTPFGTTSSKKESIVSEANKEIGWAKKLGTSFGDFVRDIGTANKMAEESFEGDSALMHTARGFVNIGVGAGMEKAMDSLWDSVWQGKESFIDRFRMGTGVAEKLNNLSLAPNQGPSEWKTRLAYLIKEGSQDIAIGTIYNMLLTFRAQQLFPRVEPKHLLESLTVDAAEALFSPNLPNQMKRSAQKSNNVIADSQIQENLRTIGSLRRGGARTETIEFERNRPQVTNVLTDEVFDALQKKHPEYFKGTRTEHFQDNQGYIDDLMHKNNLLEATKTLDSEMVVDNTNGIEGLLRSVANFSNPVSDLGISMVGEGVVTLWKNLKQVKKVRKERGGLFGKKVDMPQTDTRRNYSDRKPYDNRRDFGKKPQYKSTVYYGKSVVQKTPEEIDYEKFE